MNQFFSKFRIFNGTAHNISLYTDTAVFAVNRKGEYILTDVNAKPSQVIYQNRPLMIQKLMPIASSESTCLFFPEIYGSRVDVLSESEKSAFDIIITSSKYANFILQSGESDYIDRIYVPIPLYAENKLEKCIVGCVGLQKLTKPLFPQDYVVKLRAGGLPSIASMQICLNMYKDFIYDCSDFSIILQELKSRIEAIFSSNFLNYVN